jgi:hypothetical protein
VYVWEPTWYARTIRQAHRDSLYYLSLNLDPKKAVATSERSSTCSDLQQNNEGEALAGTTARLLPDVCEAATGTAAKLQPRQRCRA